MCCSRVRLTRRLWFHHHRYPHVDMKSVGYKAGKILHAAMKSRCNGTPRTCPSTLAVRLPLLAQCDMGRTSDDRQGLLPCDRHQELARAAEKRYHNAAGTTVKKKKNNNNNTHTHTPKVCNAPTQAPIFFTLMNKSDFGRFDQCWFSLFGCALRWCLRSGHICRRRRRTRRCRN